MLNAGLVSADVGHVGVEIKLLLSDRADSILSEGVKMGSMKSCCMWEGAHARGPVPDMHESAFPGVGQRCPVDEVDSLEHALKTMIALMDSSSGEVYTFKVP